MLIFDVMKWYDGVGSWLVTQYLLENRAILSAVHALFDTSFFILLYIATGVSMIVIMMSVVSFLSKRKEHEFVFDEAQPLFVTIQIPTYNELAALNCAKACLKQNYPKDRYEIIIGDDSNNEDVSKQIDSFATQHKDQIKVTRRGSNTGFKPGNLNNMLKYSRGDIITILDSDFLPEPHFLKHLVAPFQKDENIGAVQARWKFINQHQNLITILGSVIGLTFHHIYLPFMKKVGKVSFLCGSAEAVRKELIVKLGGWQDGSLTEDIEFSMRLLNNGYDIIYLEDHECWCEVPHVAKDLYRQQMRWAFGVVSAFLQHAKAILLNPQLQIRRKVSVHFQGMGYFFSTLLFFMFVTGTISFFSNAPAPIDIDKFVYEMSRNIVLTSGILISSIFALLKTKNVHLLGKTLVSSFSYGLIVTYYVNVGIFKAVGRKKMEWFMLNKNGNKTLVS